MAKKALFHKELAHTVPFMEVRIYSPGRPRKAGSPGFKHQVQVQKKVSSGSCKPGREEGMSALEFLTLSSVCVSVKPSGLEGIHHTGDGDCFTESTDSNAYPLYQPPHRHTQN